jgi:hypothetical protein
MSFKHLLERWAASETPTTSQEAYSIRLNVEDAARIDALADLFPGIEPEAIITDLLATALDEIEAEMPYVQGERVIREDEFGDPVYEDAGLTPKFRERVKANLKAP